MTKKCPPCRGDCDQGRNCSVRKSRDEFAEIQPTEHDRRATLATEKPMCEAGVYTARGIGDLNPMVASLAQQGFRIVTVIDTQNGDYHVVAQKESEK